MGRFKTQLRQIAARPACRFRPSLEVLEGRTCPTAGLLRPTVLSLTATSPTQATLTWADVPNETGFHVLEWTGTQAISIATLAAGTTSYRATGLPAGHRVWLSVEAFNAAQTAKSFWASVDLPTESLTPASGLTATPVSTSEIDLTWTDAQGETGYHVLEWSAGRTTVVGTVNAGQHTFAATGLSPATSYYFNVESFNDISDSLTGWVSATTLAQPIAAPTGVTATPTDTTVGLSWHAAAGATGYRVYQWDGNEPRLVGQVDGTTTKFSVSGLQPGTAYWFYVQSFNASNSASSPWLRVATTATTAPLAAPGNLSAQTTGPGQVILSWTVSNRAAGYLVYHWTGSTWEVLATPSGTATSVTLGGLPVGQPQYFLVMAFTDGFASFAASAIITATP